LHGFDALELDNGVQFCKPEAKQAIGRVIKKLITNIPGKTKIVMKKKTTDLKNNGITVGS